MLFDLTRFRRLVSLYEASSDDVLVNPTASEFQSFIKTYRRGRMLIDGDDNVIIWDAYKTTHAGMRSRIKFQHTQNILTQLSLYAFGDTPACRVHEVGDEEIHPKYTELARRNPNLVRIWGPDVTMIDIHGEP